MRLTAGSKLGPYEITSVIGAGGMGEVYRAFDTRLGREVAIKVLPGELASDSSLMARFEREARSASALNHPNIVTVFDFATNNGTTYLVMELIRGESLRELLAKGPLPLKRLLAIAAGIAEGMAAAHAAGIIHRDLKPENITLTPEGSAKILDFGLVKTQLIAEKTNSPTALQLSRDGAIFGTAAYMAPEQARGERVDFRCDHFALGLILYEMATGRHPFQRGTTFETLTSILHDEPPPLNESFPERFIELVDRCLAKDPKERYGSTADLAHDLRTLRAAGHSGAIAGRPGSRRRKMWATIIAAALLAFPLWILVTLLATTLKRPSEARRPVHFSFFPPDNGFIPLHRQSVMLALSRDGLRIAFIVGMTQQTQMWIHDMTTGETRSVPGTDGATSPFWSPDGNFVGFHSGGKLKKVDLRGNDVQTICEVSKTGAVSDWGPDGTIIFIENAGAPGIVKRVSASGGIPNNVGGLPPDTGPTRRWRNPQFLPDGQRFLVLSSRSGIARTLYIRSLDGSVNKRLFDVDSKVRFAPPDMIMFVREGLLMVQRMDLQRLEAVGDAVAVANAVHYFKATGASLFDVSETAVVYQSKAAANQLVWVNPAGVTVGSIGNIEGLQAPAVSPDGKLVAVSVPDSKTGVADIWVYDLARGFRNRVTQKIQFESFPVWSPDGSRIVFSSDLGGPPHLHTISLAEPEKVEKLTRPDFIQVSTDWSKDGEAVLFTKISETAGQDIWIVPMIGERKERILIAGDADERDARFSPDGRWISYTSDETGAAEIYVAALERPNQRIRVSTSGGKGARWNGDGSELFFINDRSELMSVPVKRGASMDFGTPRVIAHLEGTRASSGEIDEDYTYDPQSSRFLINRANTGRLSVPLEVTLNWKTRLTP